MSNNFEHCHVHTTDFLSIKVKFIHTSTVTRSHSCYGKNYAYASRTFCFLLSSDLKNMYTDLLIWTLKVTECFAHLYSNNHIVEVIARDWTIP